jgi:hypothetical protein
VFIKDQFKDPIFFNKIRFRQFLLNTLINNFKDSSPLSFDKPGLIEYIGQMFVTWFGEVLSFKFFHRDFWR